MADPGPPASLAYSALITQQWENSDLLAYFNPLTNGAANPIVGNNSPTALPPMEGGSSLYQGNTLQSILGVTASNDNYTVMTAIDQVLFDAEYQPPAGLPAASHTQLGRLDSILESVAGLLRGDANAVMTSQWDANSTNSQDSTYSDNIVSTQRDGEEQRYYLVVPYDVQQGQFILGLTLGPVTESPNDVIPPQGTTVYTPVITMPSLNAAEPGAAINSVATANSISAAIDTVLGYEYGQGSVNVRTVSISGEINPRVGTEYQVPSGVYNYKTTFPSATNTAITPTQFLTTTNATGKQTRLPASPYNQGNAVVFELTFEGQAHDIPIAVSVPAAADQQWVATKVFTTTNGTTTSTTSYAEGGASPPVVLAGDYSGSQGTPQYNAALGLTAAGNQVVAYTNQALQTDQTTPVADAYGNLVSNIYYNQLNESTDIAGPHIVGWTDGNGVDLLNAPKASAVGVNSKYMVLTFDEPMLADNPATDPDSVYNTANYQIYDSNGNLLSGVVTHVDYGLSEVSQVANLYGFTNINSTSDVPDNKWEVVLTIDDPTTGGALPNGTYTLEVLAAEHAFTGGQTGLCNIYGTPLNLTGYNQPNVRAVHGLGHDQQLDQSGRRADPAGPAADRYADQRHALSRRGAVRPGGLFDQRFRQYGAERQLRGRLVQRHQRADQHRRPDVQVVRRADRRRIPGQHHGLNDLGHPRRLHGRRRQLRHRLVRPDDRFHVQRHFRHLRAGLQRHRPGLDLAVPYLTVRFDRADRRACRTSPPWPCRPTARSSSPGPARRTTTGSATPTATTRRSSRGSTTTATCRWATSSRSRRPPPSAPLPSVAIDANDNFVIVWEGDFQSGATWGVYGDYFTATMPAPRCCRQAGLPPA